ncbi:hypothetical protein CSV71_04795 [Sporosarcina sp. P21c]|uniref:hypothetical protein n=1 Tax=unclassified Sporosarcina TaxID=2647733 RepID=UPI000C16D154|nr:MULTISPECIES: hypothetical protein [unclassified Sporosarcina]PIC68227.1 hypothetical protein CSV78_02420 [Sporosarcina sp. P16a]PIC90438.1 hypothetical protein CSV71_04795 [Sporosarcina sp. P21c]PIC93968.1 hypothetical protein CSV70_02435 [Sporosarcina sp. P25]
MVKRYLNIVWLVMSLIPAPFLFHFYEYGQYMKREDATYLLVVSILYIVITGILSSIIKVRYILLMNIIIAIVSLILAMNFISDDGGWFKPFGRDVVILLTAIPVFIGQLLIRTIAKLVIDR